jgi:hypothetical protein
MHLSPHLFNDERNTVHFSNRKFSKLTQDCQFDVLLLVYHQYFVFPFVQCLQPLLLPLDGNYVIFRLSAVLSVLVDFITTFSFARSKMNIFSQFADYFCHYYLSQFSFLGEVDFMTTFSFPHSKKISLS